MAIDNNFNYKLKLACSQIAVEWIKDPTKSNNEKGFAKQKLSKLDATLDEYLTINVSAAGIDAGTDFTVFKQAVEDALPDAMLLEESEFEYTAPITVPVAVETGYITSLALRNRFTLAEKVALYTVAKTNPLIQIYLDDVTNATFIDLTRADTRAGVIALENAGLIAPGRALIILDTPPTEIEKYKSYI